jgi:hypothetical protein
MKKHNYIYSKVLVVITILLLYLINSCKKPAPIPACGNGVCDIGEDNITCPGDCPAAPNLDTINFRAKINGSSFNYSGIAKGLYYTGTHYLVVTATNDSTALYDIVKIGLHSFIGVGTYTFNETINYYTGTNSWAYYTSGSNSTNYYIYGTNGVNPYTGTCSITKFDTLNKIVSGSFNFTARYSHWNQNNCFSCNPNDTSLTYTINGLFNNVKF